MQEGVEGGRRGLLVQDELWAEVLVLEGRGLEERL